MTTEPKIINAKVGVLELATQLGNVSPACTIMGYRRDSFYRFQELYERNGEEGLREVSRHKVNLRNRMAPELESATVDMAIAQVGGVLREAQLAARERVQPDTGANSECARECPAYAGAPDTGVVGSFKGVGRIHQQTVIDTDSKVGFAKLYTEQTPITAADLLNHRVLPVFEAAGIPLRRVLTDCGTESYRVADRHPFERDLAVEDSDRRSQNGNPSRHR